MILAAVSEPWFGRSGLVTKALVSQPATQVFSPVWLRGPPHESNIIPPIILSISYQQPDPYLCVAGRHGVSLTPQSWGRYVLF
jgi:hypothetical protein